MSTPSGSARSGDDRVQLHLSSGSGGGGGRGVGGSHGNAGEPDIDGMLNQFFVFHGNDPNRVMDALLDLLVSGRCVKLCDGVILLPTVGTHTLAAAALCVGMPRFHIQNECRIRSPRHVRLVVFGLLPKLPLTLQTALLETLAALLRHHRSNLDVCARVGLCQGLLQLLTSSQLRRLLHGPDADAVAAPRVAPPRLPATPRAVQALTGDAGKMGLLRRIVRVLAIVGSHTSSLRDLQAFLRPILCVTDLEAGYRGSPEHTVVSHHLLQALDSMARTGSTAAAYFDFTGPHCYLSIPEMVPFPRSGYTVAMWVRLERLPVEGSHRGRESGGCFLMQFVGPTGCGVELAVRRRSLVYHVRDDSGQVSGVVWRWWWWWWWWWCVRLGMSIACAGSPRILMFGNRRPNRWRSMASSMWAHGLGYVWFTNRRRFGGTVSSCMSTVGSSTRPN